MFGRIGVRIIRFILTITSVVSVIAAQEHVSQFLLITFIKRALIINSVGAGEVGPMVSTLVDGVHIVKTATSPSSFAFKMMIHHIISAVKKASAPAVFLSAEKLFRVLTSS